MYVKWCEEKLSAFPFMLYCYHEAIQINECPAITLSGFPFQLTIFPSLNIFTEFTEKQDYSNLQTLV